MGREVKRVPLDFDWPTGRKWWGFEVYVSFPTCPGCEGSGWSLEGKALYDECRADLPGFGSGSTAYRQVLNRIGEERAHCPRCGGEGSMGTEAQRSLAGSDAFYTAPPAGRGYQLWETVGDSPMSPVFEGPAELAVWMSTHPCVLGPLGSRGMVPMDEGRALKFIGVGSAPSVVMSDGTLASGTDWVAGKAEEEA